MSYANNITRLCELAFQAYAKQLGLTTVAPGNILAGFDDEEAVPTPRLIFSCSDAQPDGPPDDAVWACKLEVQYVSNADRPSSSKAAHHAAVSEIVSQMMVGRYALPELVNAAAALANPPVQFFMQDIVVENQAATIQDRRWMTSTFFRVVCCGAATE